MNINYRSDHLQKIHDSVQIHVKPTKKQKAALKLLPFAKTIAATYTARRVTTELKRHEAAGHYSADNNADLTQDIKALQILANKMKKSTFTHKKTRRKLERNIIALSARAGVSPNLDIAEGQNNRLRDRLVRSFRKIEDFEDISFEKGEGVDERAAFLGEGIQQLVDTNPKFAKFLLKNKDSQEIFIKKLAENYRKADELDHVSENGLDEVPEKGLDAVSSAVSYTTARHLFGVATQLGTTHAAFFGVNLTKYLVRKDETIEDAGNQELDKIGSNEDYDEIDVLDADNPVKVLKDSLQTLVTAYPAYAQFLIENPKYQHAFFEWVLVYRYPLELCVKYVTITEKVPQLFLRHMSKVEGALAEKTKSDLTQLTVKCLIKKEGSDVLTGKRFNILNPDELVTFSAPPENVNVNKVDAYQLTMKKMLKKFAAASNADRDHQFLEGGLYHFNTGAYAGTTTVDLGPPNERKENWWKEMPAPFKTLDLAQVKQHYGEHFQEGEWLLCPKGVFSSEKLSPLGTHAFLEVIIPNDEGQYSVYVFGRDPYKDPDGALQKLFFIGKTTEGRVISSDQGAYYNERRHEGISIAMDEETGRNLMEHIRCEILRGQAGELPFQLTWENCAKWVQDTVDTVVRLKVNEENQPIDETGQVITDDTIPPHSNLPLFRVNVSEAQYFSSLNRLNLKNIVVRALGVVHRSKRFGEEKLSLKTSPFHQHDTMHHPTQLLNKKTEGEFYRMVDGNLVKVDEKPVRVDEVDVGEEFSIDDSSEGLS